MGRSRVALLAIQRGPGHVAGEPRAILVGTKASDVEPDGCDWRYVCYPLSVLKRLLSANIGDLFGPGALQGAHYAPVESLLTSIGLPRGFFSRAENTALRTCGFKSSYLDKVLGPFGEGNWRPTRRKSAIVLRNIERVFFFSHEKGGFEGEPATFGDSPYAVFETLRHLDLRDQTIGPEPFNALPVEDRPIGSRLVLFPDWGAPAERPGALAALSLHLAIRSGANGHVIGSGDAGKLDRFDTRFLLDMRLQGSGRADVAKNLWYGTGRPEADRGIRFDTLKLGCSLAPGKIWYDPSDNEGADLFELATSNAAARAKWAPAGDPPTEWKYHSALYALGITKAVTILGREFGLRQLRWKDNGHADKLGWRFECRLSSFTDDILESSAVVGVTPRELADDVQWSADLFLAEEQRLIDIGLEPRLTHAPQTILTLRLGGGDNSTAFDRHFTDKVMGCVDRLTEAVHTGLKTVRDGRPLSLVPRLTGRGEGLPWHLVGALTDRHAGIRTSVPRGAAPDAFDARLTTLEPRAIFNMWAGAALDPIFAPSTAAFPRFRTTDRAQPRYTARLGWLPKTDGRSESWPDCTKPPAYQPAVSELRPDEVEVGTRFGLTLLAWAPTDGAASRDVFLGAVCLKLAHGFSPTEPPLGFVRVKPVMADAGADAKELTGALEAIVRLPVEAAGPATEDELPDAAVAGSTSVGRAERLPDRDTPGPAAPLLFGLTKEAAPTQTRLVLVADEAAAPDRNQDLSLILNAIVVGRGAGGAAAQAPATLSRLLMIEPRPFRVLAVDYKDFAAIAATRETAVAIWRQSEEGGASWEVPDPAQSIRLIAPPQVLGEAMEKNRGDADGRPPDIAYDRPAAARFGSLTTLDIDPTFEDRTFREPGWNTARILGRAGQRSPGARLLDLRTELHYGLVTRVRAPSLWITEIAGAIGRQPGELGTPRGIGEVARHARRAQMVLGATRGRLAVEKLWRDRPDADLTLDEGVSFKLRHRIPPTATSPGKGPATPLRWPVPGGLPEDTGGLIDPALMANTFSTRPDDSESFPGGLGWAFESANILMSVYGRPQADGGSLAGVHLSALGGYGSQRALFDARRTIVESVTAQGRVHRFRLERVGRINCLWNRAKHVIVYERTVTPSAQFYNLAPIGLRQDEQLGRAILRKVEEYVEILQPLRRFPEDGSSIKESAFLLGAEFKSTRIRVDSAWGKDVRREGWKVPLWSTDFLGIPSDPKNPDDPALIYPKPQIRVLLATDGGEAAYEVADPEKLAFYTSVVPGEDDNTDLWRSVRDVDFCDLPFPVVPRVDTGDRDLHDARTPNEREHATGYEWCTLAIAGSGEPVNLTHGRTPGAIAAVLTNVTIARGAPQAASRDAGGIEQVRHIGEQVASKSANIRAELDRRVARVLKELDKLEQDTDPQVLRNRAKALVGKALGELEPTKLRDALNKTRDDFANLKGVATSGALCDGLNKKLKAQAAGQINRIAAGAADLVKHGYNELRLSVAQAEGLAHLLLDDLTAHHNEAKSVAKDLAEATSPAQYRKARAAAEARLGALDVQIAKLEGAAQTQLKAQVEDLREHIGGLESALRAEVVELRERIGADVAALKAVIASGAETAIFSLETRLATFQTELQAAIAAIAATANNIDETAVATAKNLRTALGTARAELAKASANLERSSAPAAARRLLQTLERGLNAVDGAAAAIQRGLGKPKAELLTALEDAQESLGEGFDAVKGRLASVRPDGALDQLSRLLDEILDGAQAQIETLLTRLRTSFVTPAIDALDTLETEAAGLLTAAAGQLTTAVSALRTALQGAADSPIPPAAIAAANQLVSELQTVLDDIKNALADLRSAAKVARADMESSLDGALAAVEVKVDEVEREALKRLDSVIDKLGATCAQIEGKVRDALKYPVAEMEARLTEALGIATYAADIEDRLYNAIEAGAAQIDAIRARATQAAEAFAAQAEARARELAGSIQETAREVLGEVLSMDLSEAASRAEGVYQQGDSAIRAIRALGDPPREDHLGFNKEQVGYVLGAKKLGIDVTPTLALVNRAGDYIAAGEKAGRAVGELLDSFGIRLPVSELSDQLIPDRLKDLSVADLLPDMGGIDFRGLLSGVGFPDLDDSKAVRIRRGVDPASFSAWLEATLEIPFAQPATLFHFGPVEVAVERALFTARARMTAGRDGLTKEVDGRIFGDWRVACGGQTILTFRQTGLTFETDGHIDFKIQPDRVEIAEALRFITDLMKATGQKGGVNVVPFLRGGIPTGVAATLDMVLPPIQTGVFGIQDLSLHVLFGIAAIPEFELVCELSVGTRIAPFTLNIWVLNGGGWLTQRLSFLPMARPQPLLTYHLEIGIAVGLGIGFTFGVISGGVYLQVGCSLLVDWRTGSGGSTTAMRVFILVRGNVDVAGLITAYLLLLFDLVYDGRNLIGHGTMHFEVRVSVFYTFAVTEHVQYVFAGSGESEEGSSSDAYG